MEKRAIENVQYEITNERIYVHTEDTSYISCIMNEGYSKAQFQNRIQRIKNIAKSLKGLVTVRGYASCERLIENNWRQHCAAALDYYKAFKQMNEYAHQLQETGIFYGYWNNPLLEEKIYPLAEEMRKIRLRLHPIDFVWNRLKEVEQQLYNWDDETTGTIYI